MRSPAPFYLLRWRAKVPWPLAVRIALNWGARAGGRCCSVHAFRCRLGPDSGRCRRTGAVAARTRSHPGVGRQVHRPAAAHQSYLRRQHGGAAQQARDALGLVRSGRYDPHLVWGKTATATAAQDGRWTTTVEPPPAGGPYTMKIAGHRMTELHIILVGDVWVSTERSEVVNRLQGLRPCRRQVRTAQSGMEGSDPMPCNRHLSRVCSATLLFAGFALNVWRQGQA